MKEKIVGKGLETRTFADAKIPDATIVTTEHILSPRHTVIASFQGLRRFIQRTSSMSLVRPGTRHEAVVEIGSRLHGMNFGVEKITQRIPNSHPPRLARRRGETDGAGLALSTFWSLTHRNSVQIPVLTRAPLAP